MWTLRRNSPAEVDCPWSTLGANFRNIKSLVAVCWQRLRTYSAHWEELQTELSASRTVPLSITLSDSTTAGKPWSWLSTNRLRPAPSNQSYTNCIPICLFSNQSELHNLDNKVGLIENLSGNFCYMDEGAWCHRPRSRCCVLGKQCVSLLKVLVKFCLNVLC